MHAQNKPFVIALEEHYWDPDLVGLYPGREGKRVSDVEQRLLDLGQLRLREMDEAGIDIQVLSHGAPGTQKLDADTAVRVTRQTNDRLHAFIKTNPTRFAALAILPTPAPKAAADELERAVTQLDFKGAMIHGLTNGRFIDDKEFWPIFERARALDVPLYIHPSFPNPTVAAAYYNDYVAKFPEILGPALGFTVEAATQAVRLVLSGVLEQYPGLKLILGHLGEGIPFLLWRIDQSLSRPGNSGGSFRDAFRAHFHLTTSGNFSDTALACSIAEMGIDRILFSVDWPFIGNDLGTSWLARSSLSAEDKTKVFGANARKLLKLA
ncbi:MAG: amidohydrolase [Hyphomicrobiales bacterium]|nr:amidohydrolase [Hyphomicrobiales bacterium]